MSDQVVVQEGDIRGTGQTVDIEFQVTSWDWAADTPFTYFADLTISLVAGGVVATTAPRLRIVVNPVLTLTATSTTVSFSSPTASDFTAGSLTSGVTTSITTKANTSHKVVLSTAATNMTSTNPLAVIPASDFQWSTNASGSWSAWSGVSTSPATLLTRSAGSYTAPASVQYRSLLGWSYSVNGTHSFTFQYSIAQN